MCSFPSLRCSNPTRLVSGIFVCLFLVLWSYILQGKKGWQGIQPSRTQDKLGRRNFIWPSATGVKPKADNAVIVVSLGVICGILISQCSFSFQISEAETQSDLSSLGIWKETMNLSVAGISRDSLQILLLRYRFKHFSTSWNWNVTHQ